MTELSFKASDYVLAAAGMRVGASYSGAADDLRLADEWEAQARTKQLPSTRTEIGAGGELIDRENRCDPTVDTVAHPDYVTAEASSDRLGLARGCRAKSNLLINCELCSSSAMQNEVLWFGTEIWAFIGA
jgi:hypothetical protein